MIGVVKGDSRSLEYGSYDLSYIPQVDPPPSNSDYKG